MPFIYNLTDVSDLYNHKINIIRKNYEAFRRKHIYFRFNTLNGTVICESENRNKDRTIINIGPSDWINTWLIDVNWYPLYSNKNIFHGWYQDGLFIPVGSRLSGVGV